MTKHDRPMARELLITDRCDRCIQQAVAVVKVLLPGGGPNDTGEVLLCGHHYRTHRPVLLNRALAITEPDDFDLFLPVPQETT